VTGSQLAATFNQYFKQSKKVHPPNVARDLRSAKAQNPAPVGEDKGLWYLTNEGERQAAQLIKNVINTPESRPLCGCYPSRPSALICLRSIPTSQILPVRNTICNSGLQVPDRLLQVFIVDERRNRN
jgi:hypothetical protein